MNKFLKATPQSKRASLEHAARQNLFPTTMIYYSSKIKSSRKNYLTPILMQKY